MVKVLFTLKPIDTIIVCFGFSGFIYTLALTIMHFKSFLCEVNVNKIISRSSIMCIILFTIDNLFFVIFYTMSLIIEHIKDIDTVIIVYFWVFIWNGAQLFRYILFYEQLLCAFRNTSVYALSYFFKKFIWFLILLFGILNITMFWIIFVYKENAIHKNIPVITYATLFCLLNLLITIIIFILFVKRLRYLFMYTISEI